MVRDSSVSKVTDYGLQDI